MSLNKIMLIGNLGKNPEAKTFENGNKVVSFPLATNEVYKNKQGEKVTNTEWHNINLFKNAALFAEKYLKKGDEVYIEGSIKTTVKESNGEKKYYTSVQAFIIDKLGRKEADNTKSNNDSQDEGSDLPF